jgi:hypothetical protein
MRHRPGRLRVNNNPPKLRPVRHPLVLILSGKLRGMCQPRCRIRPRSRWPNVGYARSIPPSTSYSSFMVAGRSYRVMAHPFVVSRTTAKSAASSPSTSM